VIETKLLEMPVRGETDWVIETKLHKMPVRGEIDALTETKLAKLAKTEGSVTVGDRSFTAA